MEAEGRLLHRDWSLYDTAHVVFRPTHMTPEELAEGYALLLPAALLARARSGGGGPQDPRAVAPYLAMSYLYKRSNRLWHFLIRHRLTARGLAAARRGDAAAAPAVPAAARGESASPRGDAVAREGSVPESLAGLLRRRAGRLVPERAGLLVEGRRLRTVHRNAGSVGVAGRPGCGSRSRPRPRRRGGRDPRRPLRRAARRPRWRGGRRG